MIHFTPHMRILVATTALDMRKGMDAISAQIRLYFHENPMSGAVFLFISRSRKNIRLLTYDGQGFWLATKRLSAGKYPYWPKPGNESEFLKQLRACDAQVLLNGGNHEKANQLSMWKKIEPTGVFTDPR